MSAPLTPDQLDLLREPIHAWASVHRPDGSLHSTVVWVDEDGGDVIFNTAVGRAKERFLREDPRVSVSLLSPENAYLFLSVSGTARFETEGADAVIDALAKKYLGADRYPGHRTDETRVTVRVTPERVIWNDPRAWGQGH